MPTAINIQNDTSAGLALTTSVAPALDDKYWGVDSNVAVAGQLTRILWMDRNVGIKVGKTWVFTTRFAFAGVAIELQESLTGTFASSDLAIQIVAGAKRTGWATENTSLEFLGDDGRTYKINGLFVRSGTYDDVIYDLV